MKWTKKKKNNELNANELDKVSGGYIYLNHLGKYEVMDWNGDVFETRDTVEECKKICREQGFSERVIEWEDLEEIMEIRAGTY